MLRYASKLVWPTLCRSIAVAMLLALMSGAGCAAQEDQPMRIKVSKSAAQTGILRIWLKRVPESSRAVVAFRPAGDGPRGNPIARADVYGRGEGSAASEKYMLQLRLTEEAKSQPFKEGEELHLMLEEEGSKEYSGPQFEILEIP